MKEYDSLTVYLCWLTFGWLGAHHFYLRRDRHAFVWFWTCGGFVFGWLFEVWRIPEYVRIANADLKNATSTVLQLPVISVPSIRIKKLIGELVFSGYLGYLAVCALPDNVLSDFPWTSSAIGTFAVATGVHTVANIGMEECSFLVCLLGAFLHFPFVFLGAVDTLFTSAMWSSLCSTACATYWGRRMPMKVPARRHLFKRVAILSACNIGMVSLFFLAFYFHGEIKLADGNRLKAQVVIDRYLASSSWQEIMEKTWKLWCVLLDEGIEAFIRELSITMNPKGEQSAYKVLGVSWYASDEEIRDSYLKLVKIYHPDKFTGTKEERKEAEVKFILIQHSYEKLATRRRRKNHFKMKTEM